MKILRALIGGGSLILLLGLNSKVSLASSQDSFFSSFTSSANSEEETQSGDLYIEDAGYVPKNWHVLPENQPQFHGTDKRSPEKNEKYLDRSISTLMKAQNEALDEIEKTKRKKWRLEIVNTRLALAASGLIGIGMLKGEKALELWWRKRQPKSQFHEDPPEEGPGQEEEGDEGSSAYWRESEEKAVPSMNITGTMSKSEVEKQLAPTIALTLSTGKIKDKKKFRHNLLQKALEFQTMVAELEHLPAQLSPWFVKGFRLDVIVNAEGDVLPWVKVGGDVRLRFEWYRIRAKGGDKGHQVANGSVDKELRPLTRFVKGMAEDLVALSDKSLTGTQFAPLAFRVGIGLGLSGNIVIAKVGARVVGHLLFVREKQSLNKSLADMVPSHEPLYLEAEASEENLQFAKKHTLSYELRPLRASADKSAAASVPGIIYRISREKFRQGLAQSAKMAKYFLHRTPGKGRWELYRIRPSLDISVTGSVGLVTLTGLATAQVTIERL